VPKGKQVTAAHKQKIREGVYKHMYGPNWQEVVKNLRIARDKEIKRLSQVQNVGEDVVSLAQDQREALRVSEPKDEYGKPLEGTLGVWIPPLGKGEFLRLCSIRLRNDAMGGSTWAEIAKIFAEVKGWLKFRPAGTRRSAKPQEIVEAFDKKKPDLVEDEDVMAIVRELEEKRKGQ
jgi:hypothetical protein